MTSQTPSPLVLFVSSDLLFAGKIQAAAEPLGIPVRQVTELAAIEQILAEQPVCVVFLDLNAQVPRLSQVLEMLPAESRPMTVAFGPHVNTQKLAEARTAGCDHVLPRSRFVAELPELLKKAAGRS